MAVKALTSLAVRARSLEWLIRHKTGEKEAPPSAHSASLDLGENQKTLLDGMKAERDRLVTDIRKHCGHLPAPVSIGTVSYTHLTLPTKRIV